MTHEQAALAAFNQTYRISFSPTNSPGGNIRLRWLAWLAAWKLQQVRIKAILAAATNVIDVCDVEGGIDQDKQERDRSVWEPEEKSLADFRKVLREADLEGIPMKISKITAEFDDGSKFAVEGHDAAILASALVKVYERSVTSNEQDALDDFLKILRNLRKLETQ